MAASLIYYQLATDSNRRPDGQIVVPSKYVNAYVLGGAATAVTIPTGAKIAMFSCDGDFYINFAAAAVIPVADLTDGTASELNPTTRHIDGYTAFSVIASAACVLTVAYYL